MGLASQVSLLHTCTLPLSPCHIITIYNDDMDIIIYDDADDDVDVNGTGMK